ncbi:hypothetical protein [Wohlfahrtiimonas larvae]|uniref:Uncharacterized protein n=1 Tax=Wohlfahrtiimonas larvae TaxID=1157986 RepID=A0ABP9MI54_9GAMM|nr:hypothetical protein [Wohlfahrtiimonas larvae]
MINKFFIFIFLFLNLAFADQKVTVEMPTMDLDPVKVFIASIVVIALGCSAVLFGMRKSSNALDPDGDAEFYYRKSLEK